jgi:hypothetical protein
MDVNQNNRATNRRRNKKRIEKNENQNRIRPSNRHLRRQLKDGKSLFFFGLAGGYLRGKCAV